ncbi:MAG: PHP domain-containing protein [Nitrospirota bacterium]
MRGASAIVGLVALSVTVGCTLPSTFHAIRQELAALPAEPASPADPELRRFKGVVHVHTHLSHDSRGDEDEIVRAARAAGLDFVMLTDHNRPAIFESGMAGERNGVLLIRGAEFRCDDQYLLAVGIDRFLDPQGLTCAEVATAITAQGGLPIGAHPNRLTLWDEPSVAGVEVWDLYDEAKTHRWRYLAWALDVAVWYGTYPGEILSRTIRRPDRALAAFDQQTTRRRLTAVATPDAHQNVRVLGRQLDPYPLAFRLVPLYVLAPDRTRDGLLAALRQGRVYFAFEVFKPAPDFEFRVIDGTGTAWHMGDEVPVAHGLTVEVFAPHRGLITVLRDGRPVAHAEAARLSLPAPGAGVYRAEVALSVQGQWRPWIFSNPIYVR